MTIENIDVSATLERVSKQLENDKEISETTRSLIEVLVLIVTLLVNRIGLNSRNSSKPPSADQNRKKPPCKGNEKKQGGQKGHKGTMLAKVDDPDIIEDAEH
ncbi:MAG: DUF6444 domain-containing protein [Pontiella sp.]